MLCSCSTALVRNTRHTEFFLGARVFQVLNSNESLAHDGTKVVKFITAEEVYYEGLDISGKFVLVDTYTYETVEHKIKVVPVYVRLSEYNKYTH